MNLFHMIMLKKTMILKQKNKNYENFKLNLQNLKKQLNIWNIKPFLYTNKYDINGDKILFF